MVIAYKDSDKFQALAPIVGDYTNWFGQIAFATAYPDKNSEPITTPSSFEEWIESARKAGDLNAQVLRGLNDIYEHMVNEGVKIIDMLKDGYKPEADQFSDFQDYFNSFLRRVRRLEHDSALEGSGIDEETGLRIPKAINDDMKRELARLERQGTSFCLVMARIDKFMEEEDRSIALGIAVDSIKKTMRPFDDAYYLRKGHFIINMKQTDIIGAESGVNRLRAFMEEDPRNAGRAEKMTLSFCMVEPVVGDTADELIEKMQLDLDEHSAAKDAVLKFKEISDLERFVSTIN